MKFALAVTLCCFLILTDAGRIQKPLLAKFSRGVEFYDVILELPSVSGNLENYRHTFTKLSRSGRIAAVRTALQAWTKLSQAPFVKKAEELGVKYETFWASNIIKLQQVSFQDLQAFESFEGEFVIRDEHIVTLPPFEARESRTKQQAQWGVEMIRAPEAWTITDGEGAVVALIDTGANLNHEALRDGYAGAGGWLDPYYNSTTPTDNNGHGSHTLGIMVGKTNGIGVAPGAQWIACRGLNDQGAGSESRLTTCAQFMLTATPSPNVVNNAWGGGADAAWFEPQMQAWIAAGIVPVFASGGSGPGCGTIGAPGKSPLAISATMTTQEDVLPPNTSRGPGPNGIIKPDLGAPGVNIVSAGTGDNNYVSMSGSSFSASFVSGTIALIGSAHPDLDVDQIYRALTESAYQRNITSPDDYCGPGPDNWPNNGLGWGRVDAAASLGLKRN